jgi:hypothetical protein
MWASSLSNLPLAVCGIAQVDPTQRPCGLVTRASLTCHINRIAKQWIGAGDGGTSGMGNLVP